MAARSVPADVLSLYVYYVVPLLVSVVSLACFSFLGKPLTAEVAFPALALFNILR